MLDVASLGILSMTDPITGVSAYPKLRYTLTYDQQQRLVCAKSEQLRDGMPIDPDSQRGQEMSQIYIGYWLGDCPFRA